MLLIWDRDISANWWDWWDDIQVWSWKSYDRTFQSHGWGETKGFATNKNVVHWFLIKNSYIILHYFVLYFYFKDWCTLIRTKYNSKRLLRLVQIIVHQSLATCLQYKSNITTNYKTQFLHIFKVTRRNSYVL